MRTLATIALTMSANVHQELCISLNLRSSRLKLPSMKTEVLALADKAPWVWSLFGVFILKNLVYHIFFWERQF